MHSLLVPSRPQPRSGISHPAAILQVATPIPHPVPNPAPLQVAQFLAGIPQFSDLSPLQIDLDSFPF